MMEGALDELCYAAHGITGEAGRWRCETACPKDDTRVLRSAFRVPILSAFSFLVNNAQVLEAEPVFWVSK